MTQAELGTILNADTFFYMKLFRITEHIKVCITYMPHTFST